MSRPFIANKHGVIPYAKYLLTEIGFAVGETTFPMRRYTAEHKKAILADAVAAGFKL